MSFSAGSAFISSSSFLSYLCLLVLLSFLLPLLFSLLPFSAFVSSAYFPSYLCLLVIVSFLLPLLFSLLALRLLFSLFPPPFCSLGFLLTPEFGFLFCISRAAGFFFFIGVVQHSKGPQSVPIKAAHEHMKVQRLSWGRLSFAGCLPVLLLYIILVSSSAVLWKQWVVLALWHGWFFWEAVNRLYSYGCVWFGVGGFLKQWNFEILCETPCLKFCGFSEQSFRNKDGVQKNYLARASSNIFEVMSFMCYICVAKL